MEHRPLGRTGISVSALGFGCGAVGGLMVRGDSKDQVRAVGRALEAGINYFDTAPSYGDGESERNLGRALREIGISDEVVVATKVRLDPAEVKAAAGAIRRSLEASLQRLRLERVQLIHLHNAIGAYDDPGGTSVPLNVAAEQVAEGLRRAVDDGLTEHVGFTAVGETRAIKELATRPAYETAQAYLNILNPSGVRPAFSGGQQDFDGFVTDASEHEVGVIAIRVYAAGALVATPARHQLAWLPSRPLIPGSEYDRDVTRARRLERLATESGLDGALEMGLRFVLAAPGAATALVGISSFEQLEAALRWTERGPLAGDLYERVVELARDS